MAGKTTSRSGKRRLGRGLGSLISSPVEVPVHGSSTATEAASPPANAPERPAGGSEAGPEQGSDGFRVQSIPIADVQPNPKQPRQTFDEQALSTLAESIRSAGLMQPIVVRPRGADRYEIIAGERRWRAARMIGLEQIPAVVREVDDHEAAEWSLIENIQREDLNPIERAEAFRRLMEDYSMTQQQVAERVGIDRSNVANHLRLLDLDDSVRDMVTQGLLSLGQGRALLAITNIKQRQALAAKAVRDGWTVRMVEQKVKQALDPDRSGGAGQSKSGPTRSAHMQDLEKRLGEHLGTKVEVRPGRGKGAGQLVIRFYNNDQFEGILERLDFSVD